MNTPLVSILLPLHNAAVFLRTCLQSLFRQTYPHFEIIAVDDGSADDTRRIIAEHAQGDQRIKLLEPGRVGLVGALNLGLRVCRSDLVARMDGDDICRRDRIERQVTALIADPALTLIASRTVSFPRDNLAEGFQLYEAWQNTLLTPDEIDRNFFIESPIAHPSVMFRKQTILAAGGYQDNGLPEDYDLWLRLRGRGARFAKLPQTLLAWRMHADRHSLLHARYSREAFFSLKREFLLPTLPGQVAVLGAGRVGRAWIKVLREKGINVVAALDIDPRKHGHAIQGVPIVPYTDIRTYPREFILVAVGKRGQREVIRDFLGRSGREERRDYLCVA